MYPRERLRRAMLLYAVTDRAWLGARTLPDCVEAALRGGATFVQLREKDAGDAEVAALARAILPLCRRAGVPFVVAAQAAGADYLGVGALIATPTKTDAALVAPGELRAICQAVNIPVVAIGGLNERTMDVLAGTGVDGAAVVSALFAANDPCSAARALVARIRSVLE